MPDKLKREDLVFHFLNVGFGDTCIVQFPEDANGEREYGVIDCYKANKTLAYLAKLQQRDGLTQEKRLAFVCATHPHYDHIAGISSLLRSAYCPMEFWDSGFRHKSATYAGILENVLAQGVNMRRVTSGMEGYFGRVRITALAPSVSLRNRYATYGVDMNNASIVLRFEHTSDDAILMRSREYRGTQSAEAVRDAGRSVVILAGDAEYDSWSYVTQEYPQLERSSEHDPLVKKVVSYLSAAVIKVAHHGSMHSAPLDLYEKMHPELAIISTKQEQSTRTLRHGDVTRDLFPHRTATLALEECGTEILTTDGSYEQTFVPQGGDQDLANPGSIVVAVAPGGRPRRRKLGDTADQVPEPPPTE